MDSFLAARTDLVRTSPGRIELLERDQHRVDVHVGAPTRGRCRHPFTTTSGDIHLFPARMSDVWEEVDPSTTLVVHIPPALLHRTAEGLDLDPTRAGLDPRSHFKDRQLEHIAWALEAERDAGHPHGRLYVESLSTALAIQLLRGYSAPLSSAPLSGGRGLSPLQLRGVKTYIEEHLDRDLSLERLARVASVSTSHFKSLFKRSTGMPVHAYVIQRRVERAKALLLNGDLPITEVALETGFAHASHLARCMRRVLGITPSVLRRGAGTR